jgi:hypothetical protein
LSRQIDAASRAFVVIESLRSANMVVDTLGEDAVTDLLEMLIQMQVLPYQVRAGVPGGELFGLQKEKLDKRWELLYSILGASSAPHMQRVMSAEWAVTFKLYVQFCRRTAIHLETLLDLEVEKLYQRGRSFLVREPSPANPEGSEDSSHHLRKPVQEKVTLDPSLVQEHGNFVVQTLKSVLAVEQEVHKMFDDGVFALSAAGFVSAADSDTPASYTCFAMSKVFDKYLDPFVQAERHNVQELIQTLVAEDVKRACPEPEPLPEPPTQSRGGRRGSTQPPPAEPKRVMTDDSSVDMIAYSSACQSVFNSAEVLFQTIRSSLLRCASFSTGKPLLSLSMEYKVCIQIYAENIRSSLLPTIPNTAKRVGRRTAHALTLDEEVLVCRAITTAERCITLIPQMQSEIGVKIRSDYAADVDMRFQIELLADVTYYALDMLVGSLLGRINESLVHMANASWADMSHVGDSSSYVRMINNTIMGVVPRMRKVLSPKSFDIFCTRLSSDFLDHFLALIMGLRKVSVVGAEQLLLDITDLKPVLLKLHLTALPAKSFERQSMVVGQNYVETVNKKSQLIELVLKLICTDDEQFEETFYIMWPEGQEADMTAIRNLRISGTAAVAGGERAPAVERKSSSESISDNNPSRLGNAVESLRSKANVLTKFKIPGRRNKGAAQEAHGRDSF